MESQLVTHNACVGKRRDCACLTGQTSSNKLPFWYRWPLYKEIKPVGHMQYTYYLSNVEVIVQTSSQQFISHWALTNAQSWICSGGRADLVHTEQAIRAWRCHSRLWDSSCLWNLVVCPVGLFRNPSSIRVREPATFGTAVHLVSICSLVSPVKPGESFKATVLLWRHGACRPGEELDRLTHTDWLSSLRLVVVFSTWFVQGP